MRCQIIAFLQLLKSYVSKDIGMTRAILEVILKLHVSYCYSTIWRKQQYVFYILNQNTIFPYFSNLHVSIFLYAIKIGVIVFVNYGKSLGYLAKVIFKYWEMLPEKI